MVQCCWIWFVWIVWQLEWTSTWQLGWKIRSALRGRMVLPEVQHWKLVESYRLQTLCECHERGCGAATDLDPGENLFSGEDAGMHGQRGAFSRWQRGAGEGTRATPEEAPKNTAKHIEAKQNWINRETKRIEVEVEKVAGDAGEYQSSEGNSESCLRRNQEIPESVDQNRSHVLSPESLEEVRNLELQELYLRRATASKRVAGATREATTEEIVSWSVEADRIAAENSGKKKKYKRRSKESIKDDIKMPDGGMDGLDGPLSS